MPSIRNECYLLVVTGNVLTGINTEKMKWHICEFCSRVEPHTLLRAILQHLTLILNAACRILNTVDNIKAEFVILQEKVGLLHLFPNTCTNVNIDPQRMKLFIFYFAYFLHKVKCTVQDRISWLFSSFHNIMISENRVHKHLEVFNTEGMCGYRWVFV